MDTDKASKADLFSKLFLAKKKSFLEQRKQKLHTTDVLIFVYKE